MLSRLTVTDLANSCVTPLFRRPQGSQGCLEKRNHPLSSNLVVWCAKIGPKTKKVPKTSEQGCINCIRSPAMATDQIANFCPFLDWLKKSEISNQLLENWDSNKQSTNLKKDHFAYFFPFSFYGFSDWNKFGSESFNHAYIKRPYLIALILILANNHKKFQQLWKLVMIRC